MSVQEQNALSAGPSPNGGLARGPGAITLGSVALMGFLSLTATPDTRSLARLSDMGLSQGLAATLLHLAPIAIVAVLTVLGWYAARGRSQAFSIGIACVTAALVGFLTAFCLNIFEGLAPMLERALGPLAPASAEITIAWALTGITLLMAISTTLVGVFGTPAMRIMTTNPDPECAVVRPRDRAMMVWSGVGVFGFAFGLGALTLLQQADAASTLTRWMLIGLCVLGTVVYTGSSLILWRKFDELYRRLVVDSFSWSGIIITVVAVGWALAEGAGYVGAPSAFSVALLLLTVQTIIPVALSGKLSMMESR